MTAPAGALGFDVVSDRRRLHPRLSSVYTCHSVMPCAIQVVKKSIIQCQPQTELAPDPRARPCGSS